MVASWVGEGQPGAVSRQDLGHVQVYSRRLDGEDVVWHATSQLKTCKTCTIFVYGRRYTILLIFCAGVTSFNFKLFIAVIHSNLIECAFPRSSAENVSAVCI